MARVTVDVGRINQAEFRALRTSPSSPIVRNMRARALLTQTAAKQRLRQAPRRIDTGNLVNSIQTREIIRDGTVVEQVGTNVEYALFVHDGTRFMEANPFLRDGLRNAMQRF